MNRQITEDELKRLFPNASPGLLAANADPSPRDPELPLIEKQPGREEGSASSVRPKLERHDRGGRVGKAKNKERRGQRFLVRITSVRSRLIDEDNLCGKLVCDLCRYAGALPSDAPGETKIEVGQRKAEKGELQTTIVEVWDLHGAS